MTHRPCGRTQNYYPPGQGERPTKPKGTSMSQKTLIVLSRPGCVQCTATYRALNKKGIEYTIGDALSEDSKVITAEHKIMSAPAVLVMQDGKITEAWGGFRPDLIDAYAADPEAVLAAPAAAAA